MQKKRGPARAGREKDYKSRERFHRKKQSKGLKKEMLKKEGHKQSEKPILATGGSLNSCLPGKTENQGCWGFYRKKKRPQLERRGKR